MQEFHLDFTAAANDYENLLKELNVPPPDRSKALKIFEKYFAEKYALFENYAEEASREYSSAKFSSERDQVQIKFEKKILDYLENILAILKTVNRLDKNLNIEEDSKKLGQCLGLLFGILRFGLYGKAYGAIFISDTRMKLYPIIIEFSLIHHNFTFNNVISRLKKFEHWYSNSVNSYLRENLPK